MGAVVLTNGDDGDAVLSDLFRAIAQEYAWPDYQPQRVPVMMSPDSFRPYTGEYESRRGFALTISQRDDSLFLEAKGQLPIELQPSSENTFFAQALDSEISFAKNEAGEVTGLSLKQEEQQMGAKKVR